MRPYTNSLAAVSATYPSSVYVPRERLNESDSYSPVTQTGVIGTTYTVALDDLGILQQATLTVVDTTTTTTLIPVPWEINPASTEVAVDYERGLLRFHSTRYLHNLSVTFTPFGTVSSSDFENGLQKEIAATQTQLNAVPGTTADEFTVNSDKGDVDVSLSFGRSGQTNPARLRWNKTYSGFYLLAGGANDTGQANLGCNDLTVAGNLTVNGTTTTLSTTNLTVEDNVVVLNDGVTGAPSTNAGIEIERGSSTNASILWDETSDSWKVGLVGSETAVVLTGDARLHSQNTDTGTTATSFYLGTGSDSGLGIQRTDANNMVLLVGGDSGIKITAAGTGSSNLTQVAAITGAPGLSLATLTNGDISLSPNGTGSTVVSSLLKIGPQAYAYNFTPTKGIRIGAATGNNYYFVTMGDTNYDPLAIHAGHGYAALKLWSGSNAGMTLGRNTSGLFYITTTGDLSLNTASNNDIKLNPNGTGTVACSKPIKFTAAGVAMQNSDGTPILSIVATANFAFGLGAAQTATSLGSYNYFIGSYAAYAANGGSGDGCQWNTCVGTNSMRGLTSGSYNVGVGGVSLGFLSTGSYNVGIGYNAGGTYGSSGISSGGYNIAIGANAMSSVAITGSRNCAIGCGADLSSGAYTGAYAIGYNARVAQDYSVCFGGGDTAYKVGVNTLAPTVALDVTGAILASTNITATGVLTGTNFRLPTSAPGTPAAGDAYFSSNTLYIYNGSAWRSVALGA